MSDLATKLLLLGLVGLLAAFAALTRWPAAPIFERASGWPLVGNAVAALRRPYLAELAAAAAEPVGAGGGTEIVRLVVDGRAGTQAQEEVDWALVGALPEVWLRPGARLYERPDAGGKPIAELAAHTNLGRLEHRAGWLEVRTRDGADRPVRAWVEERWVAADPAPAPPEPAPVLPLAAVPIDPALEAAARKLLADRGRRLGCGRHPLLTDVVGDLVAERCRRLAAELERHYPARYGVRPVSGPAETVVVFARRADYEGFQRLVGPMPGRATAFAAAARGVVALDAEDRTLEELSSSLLHELTHLLNRRALGPALPPWLAEGLADDLAESAIGADGRLEPGALGGGTERTHWRIERRGARAAAVRLAALAEAGRLPALAALVAHDDTAFNAAPEIHYAAASFWIRYLLSGRDPELARGFRSFLAAVAAGERLDAELLARHLSRPLAELEPAFELWLRLQQLEPATVDSGRG